MPFPSESPRSVSGGQGPEQAALSGGAGSVSLTQSSTTSAGREAIIMADFEGIGKLVIPLIGALSLTVWWQTLLMWRQGESPLLLQPHELNSWPASTVVLTFIAAFFAPSLLQFAILFFVPENSVDKADLLIAKLLSGQLAQIGTVLLLLCIETRNKLRRVDLGLEPLRWLENARIGALAFLASLLPVYLVNVVVYLLGWHSPETEHQILGILQGKHSPFALVGAIMSAIVMAPLTEELMYRVVLQGGLERWLPKDSALWLTAIVFAGVHSLSGRPDALPLFPLALIMGYVYRQTHSFVAVFTLHALFNALSVAMKLLARPA